MKQLFLATLACCAFSAALPADPVRPAPPLSFVSADGMKVSLEALKGNVVVVEFMLTHCPACQESARMLSRLQNEYVQQGLRVVALAMDPEAPLKLKEFSTLYATSFPIGIYSNADARKWLQTSEVMRLLVPVIVVIDRAGNIREQHPPDEKPWADKKEGMLRASLKTLLAEKAPRPSATAKPASSKPAAKK